MVKLTRGQKAKKTRLAKSPQQRAIDTRHFRSGRLKAEITKLKRKLTKEES